MYSSFSSGESSSNPGGGSVGCAMLQVYRRRRAGRRVQFPERLERRPAVTAAARNERVGEFLFTHVEGIAAYCDHPVRFGVVESINTTIKAVLRRARGMRDEAMLVLKLKWATARPIRSARDVMRFLHPEAVPSVEDRENTSTGRSATRGRSARP